MENSLKFKNWIFQKAKSGQLKIAKLNWPQKYGLRIYDYMVECDTAYSKISGRGTDTNEDQAIFKAVAETYERYMRRKFKLNNTNGCAAHIDESLCKEKAKAELIERDCFLFKFIHGEAFTSTHNKHFQINLKNSILTNFLLMTEQSIFITMTRIEIAESGNILGLGSGRSLKEAIASSEIEALRQWVHLFGSSDPILKSYYEILNKQNHNFDDHGDIALTKEHHDSINYLFGNSGQLSKFTILTDEFKYLTDFSDNDPNSPFYLIPLFFAKASHDFAQELFTGPTEPNINSKRIDISKGLKNLNLCLHPFR